jgi:hypothetical protein
VDQRGKRRVFNLRVQIQVEMLSPIFAEETTTSKCESKKIITLKPGIDFTKLLKNINLMDHNFGFVVF